MTLTTAIASRNPPVPAGERLSWERDGQAWPHRDASRFVTAAGLRWHVQQAGAGPVLLLVHGTGAATHSWRNLLPLLTPHLSVVTMDLPGHGFTDAPAHGDYSLSGMATALSGLLAELGATPDIAVGHSAGAAILARMCIDARLSPRQLISLNGALLPFGGLPGQLFAPLARLLACTTVAPRFFAWRASDPNLVTRLMRETGSCIDPAGMGLYRLLARNPHHVAAALAMMANWDLETLARDLPRLSVPLAMLAANDDRMIPPDTAYRIRSLLPAATVDYVRGAGHLAHEESPAMVAELILRHARAHRLVEAG